MTPEEIVAEFKRLDALPVDEVLWFEYDPQVRQLTTAGPAGDLARASWRAVTKDDKDKFAEIRLCIKRYIPALQEHGLLAREDGSFAEVDYSQYPLKGTDNEEGTAES